MADFLEIMVGKFTFKVAADRLYTAEGLWIKADGKIVRMGVSDFLQQRSGDVAFVELKPEGTSLSAGSFVAGIETIKVTVNFNSPVAGMVVRLNPAMETTPEIINLDPYGEGWLCEVETSQWEMDRQGLLDPQAYFAQIKQETETEAGENG